MLSRPTTPTSTRPWNTSFSSGTTTPFTEEADTLIDEGDGVVDALRPSDKTDAPSEADIGALHHHQQLVPGSGVEWRCGRPGLELLISAVEESKNTAAIRPGMSAPHDPAFERRAYLDGVAYLLRGLPRDLDETEVSVLSRALPSTVAGVQPNARGQLAFPQYASDGDMKPSMLHNTTRMVVTRTIVWFCILWPYILFLLKWLAAYERKHRISDQVVAQGRALATACGRWTVGMSEAIVSKGDGRVGQALADAVAWTVHDMVAGVSEGVQDGLSRVGGGPGS